jgi:hypothetical protein
MRLVGAGVATLGILAALGMPPLDPSALARAHVAAPSAEATRGSPAEAVYRLLPARRMAITGSAAQSRPAAASFTFDKRVMLQSDYDRSGCGGPSKDSLTVYHGTLVAYCYTFTNTGTTAFVTHVMNDDKLGSTGTIQMSVPPGGQVGFAAVPPDGVTQDVTNIAVWTATDETGATVSRSDSATVKVVIPLTGHVFMDDNGDGVRQGSEKSGIANVTVTLNSRPATSGNQRQTKTAANGYYEFLDVVEGPSTVAIQLPAGYVATSPTSLAVDLVSGVPKTANFGVRAATATPRPEATVTASPTPTMVITETATVTPTITLTAVITPTAELTPTETPSTTPSPTSDLTPTDTPTATVPSPAPSRLYLPVLIDLTGISAPLAPALMPIKAPGADSTYLLSWTPIYGALIYELERSSDSSFTPPVEQIDAGDRVSAEIASRGAGTFYHRVRGRNQVGPGPWSEARSVFMSWEAEPNDAIAEANVVIADVALFSMADDENDYYTIAATKSGTVSVRLEDITGHNVRLVLYYGDVGNVRATDTTAPYMVSAEGPPGAYYVRVFFGETGEPPSVYRLTASYR